MRRTVLLVFLLILAPAAAASASHFPDSISLPAGFAPEDMALGQGSTFYVGSLAGGAGIYTGDLRTGRGRVLVPGVRGRAEVGVFVDRRDRLWVTGGSAGDVRVYDATSGTLLASYALNGEGGFISDVIVTDRVAYLTDSFEQQMYVIPLSRGRGLPAPQAVRTVPLRGDIAYTDQPFAFNANGVAERDGRLILGQTNAGKLFTADPDTGWTDEIDLGGANVFGADGIELKGNRLYVSENFPQSVSIVELEDDLTSGRLTRRVRDERFDTPTSVAVFGNGLYALNARLTTAVTPQTTYDIVRVDRP